LFFRISSAILAPMILARTAQNSAIFGTVGSMFALGAILDGLAMSAWWI
jgi:hypothetical protein